MIGPGSRLHPSMATTWSPVLYHSCCPPPSLLALQASSELLKILLLSPVSRWSNRPGDVTSYSSCATSCCALAVRFKPSAPSCRWISWRVLTLAPRVPTCVGADWATESGQMRCRMVKLLELSHSTV
ncbi:hypothetical protein PAHAL_2G343800 [Panicum hallii]|uniref:Uncharacterized protein n=1 Tax=Panicum hallii TaxID=206008 RepID=A0A2T8KRC8_9POAL|nr:hypothetical protein PAHAL_2G343800 [Panicum hallii]